MFRFFAQGRACEFLCWGAMNAENMQCRPHSLILMSAPPPLPSPYLSSLVPSFRHTADTSAVLFLHCQGANKPWKVSIRGSSDQNLACTWKLSCICVLRARLAPEHSAWWQAYNCVGLNWRWAKRLDTHGFLSDPLFVQMWATLWLQWTWCRSKPVNLIPISWGLIMCLPALTFVRKQNKKTEKRREKSQKKGGGLKKPRKWSKTRAAKRLFGEVTWQRKA